MGYLSEDRLDEIADAVRILPISSDEISDIKQYDLDCGEASEYEMFLKEKAMEFDKLCVSKTFLMIHRETQELIGYFSLATDTIKLTTEEKNDTELGDVQFMSLPALKVGKLAVNHRLSDKAKRKGYGSFALEMAATYAYELNEIGVACRFLTVDADIEYNEETPEFYLKNGFVYNLSKKRRPSDRTISMRKDIFID